MKIIITGVSQGLGKCLANRLLHEGRDVIGFARSAAPNEWNLFRETTKYMHHQLDLAEPESVAKVCSLILLHKPDVLLLNAAQYHSIEAKDEDGFQHQLQLNLLFPLLLIHRLQTSAIDWKLKVVFVSSIMARIVDAKNPLYAASKAALSHYIEGSRLASNPNLSFVNVYPGPMEQELHGLIPTLISATYSDAADAIIDNFSSGRKSLYIPAIWRFVIAVNGFLPNQLIARR